MRDLERTRALPFPPPQVGHGLVKVGHAVDQYRTVVVEVVGEQKVWRGVAELDQRDASAHTIDREAKARAEHVDEVPEVFATSLLGR